MPKRKHRALAKRARAKGMTGKRYKRYVYGSMNKKKGRRR